MKFRRQVAVWLGIAGLSLAAAPGGAVLGDGVVRDSVGAISSGRGGANIAFSDNGAVLLSNPAGMVARDRGLLDVGVAGLVTDLEYSDPDNRRVRDRRQLHVLPDASVIYRDESTDWAAGLGVFIPAGFGAEWRMNAPFPIPGRETYRSQGSLIKILPGAAWRMTERLSVGGTVGVALSQAELRGPFFVQGGDLAGAPTVLDLEADGVSVTWSVGAQYQLSERTTLGAVYTSEDRFRLRGDASATVFVLPPVPPVPLPSEFDAQLDLVWPQSVGVGLAHELTARQRVGVDVVWYNWSRAFDGLDLRLSNPTNPAFAPLSPIRDTFPLRWRDSVSLRLGHEYLLSCCDTLRVGYIYNSPTVPRSTLTPYIPAVLEHTVSAGYGRRWGCNRIDLAYQYAFGPRQHVSDSHISGLPGMPGDFDNSRLKAQAHWMFLSYIREF